MTNILAQPRRPVENWQQKLDDWIADVNAIIHQARTWSQTSGWATKEDQKVISEEILGTYEAPSLLIHTPQGRLLLDPVARYVVGAEGRFDFCVMPSYDSMILAKNDGVWRFVSTSRSDLALEWSEESFGKVALELLKLQ